MNVECPDCEHRHAGPNLGNICIGCPCPRTDFMKSGSDDELEECTGCGLRAPADDLAECVNHIPAHGRGPYHCHDCVNSGCCGPCQDQAAKEWQAEHGGGPR